MRWIAGLLATVVACAADTPTVDVDTWSPVGSYSRVVPGYADEATCLTEHPDQVFNCVETLALCAHGIAAARFTDVQDRGRWSPLGAPTRVLVRMDDAPELTRDGFVELTLDDDGSLFSDEVYGDRPFVPGGQTLCP